MHDARASRTIHQNLSLDWKNRYCPREESNGATEIQGGVRLSQSRTN